MPVVEVNIIPLGTPTPSVSKYVKKALDVLRKENLHFELTAMGTIIEGDSLEEILATIRKMHASVFDAGVLRVVTTIKIDERKDKKLTLKGKVKAVLDDKP